MVVGPVEAEDTATVADPLEAGRMTEAADLATEAVDTPEVVDMTEAVDMIADLVTADRV